PRIKGIGKVVVYQEDNTVRATQNKSQPVVIKLKEEESLAKFKENMESFINNSPFLILAKEGKDFNYIQIIVNHEFFDGLPSHYYMNGVLKRLDLEEKRLNEMNVGDANKLLAEADANENFRDSDEYQVDSSILSNDLTEDLVGMHQKVVNNEIKISFESFVQLFVATSNGVDGQKVIGGVLNFKRGVHRQLEHNGLGNATKLFDKLLEGDIDYLKENGFWIEDQNRVGIFRPEAENISPIIGKIAGIFKSKKIREWVNNLSKKTGLAQAISGQILISVLPNGEISLSRSDVVSLAGTGGPALTDFQDGAYTINILKDGDSVESIVVRRKFKREIFPELEVLTEEDLSFNGEVKTIIVTLDDGRNVFIKINRQIKWMKKDVAKLVGSALKATGLKGEINGNFVVNYVNEDTSHINKSEDISFKFYIFRNEIDRSMVKKTDNGDFVVDMSGKNEGEKDETVLMHSGPTPKVLWESAKATGRLVKRGWGKVEKVSSIRFSRQSIKDWWFTRKMSSAEKVQYDISKQTGIFYRGLIDLLADPSLSIEIKKSQFAKLVNQLPNHLRRLYSDI
ncbi:MAG: hypothetical protein U9Q63_04190, partial [Patescibacteria group bacterium]|nr:hypothetical protein [Patescibacteria group bacterium]